MWEVGEKHLLAFLYLMYVNQSINIPEFFCKPGFLALEKTNKIPTGSSTGQQHIAAIGFNEHQAFDTSHSEEDLTRSLLTPRCQLLVNLGGSPMCAGYLVHC